MINKFKINHNPKDTYVLVLMGGWSVEREISLITGGNITEALIKAGYKVKTYDLTKNIIDFIKFLEDKPNVVFNALHGKIGEDGCIQGLLEILDIKYTHSGVSASAIAMDKILTKKIVQKLDIATPEYVVKNWNEINDDHPIEPPYVIKPRDEGSSLGVYLIEKGEMPIGAKLKKRQYSEPILVERYINGVDLNVPVINDKILPIVAVYPHTGFYSYENKYTENKSIHVVPADIPDHIYKLAQKNTLILCNFLNCKGISRTEYIYSKENDKIYFLEINNQPGMTKLSPTVEAADNIGISYTDLCMMIIDQSLK